MVSCILLTNQACIGGIRYPIPRRYEEASSAGADGSGLALFERSEFSQTPAAPSNAAYPRYARGDESGSPSFAYFSWRRKKSECAIGRTSRHPPRPPAQDPATSIAQTTEPSGQRLCAFIKGTSIAIEIIAGYAYPTMVRALKSL